MTFVLSSKNCFPPFPRRVENKKRIIKHIRYCFTDYDRRTQILQKFCGVAGKVPKVAAQLSFRSSGGKWAA